MFSPTVHKGFQLLHTFSNTYFPFKHLIHPSGGMKWYIAVAFICISLINYPECLFKSSPLLSFSCCLCCSFALAMQSLTACRIFSQRLKPWPLHREHGSSPLDCQGSSHLVLKLGCSVLLVVAAVEMQEFLYILDINYQVYYLQIFSPFCELSFHYLDSVF